ncbi:MAG: hypothetical protein P1V51_05030 [Deltaproteobacteria bacterium]|nr:hypothetical protein [Deltaproteobacteria bacterium]
MKTTIRTLALLCAFFAAETAALAAAKLVSTGREGAFYVSQDDGKVWRRVPSGVSTYLNGVTSDNRGAFVAVGAKGVILRSVNYGKTWKKVSSGVTESLTAIAFDEVSDRMVAVGAQAVILRSDDLGLTWTRVPVESDAELYGVATDGQGTWVAVGTRGQVASSSDDAESFTLPDPATRHQLNDLTYAKGHFVAAGVGGTVVSSADGGTTWKGAETGSKLPFEGVAVDGLGNVLAVGWKGSIYRSENGGETWSAVASGSTARLFAATPFGEQGFVITGEKGLVLRSEDGGVTWKSNKKPNGRQNIETVAQARLPNLGLSKVHLDEACEVVVTIASTGPARLPSDAWDGRVTLAIPFPKGFLQPVSLAELDPAKALLVPGTSVTTKIPGAKVAGKKKLKLTLDPGQKLVQASRADDEVEAELECAAP